MASISSRGNRLRVWLLATSAFALSAGAAQAAPLPSGGAVASGAASITSPSATQLTITQSSAKAILTWNAFSIGAGNTVQFNNGSGATLNRVTGTGASQIDGSLLATGSVYLVNPNGVVVGKTGVVNTGGTFVASSLDIGDSAFLAGGALTFSGTSAASVVNLGQVGSTGGDVVLAAQTVENDGAITAPAGDVGLLAGSQVTLSDTLTSNGKFSIALGSHSDATNSGQITAALAELRAYGGNVYALAGNGGGAITATGVATHDGQIFLDAQSGFTQVAGALNAQGAGGAPGQVATLGQDIEIVGATVNPHGGAWLVQADNLTLNPAAATAISDTLNLGANVTAQVDPSHSPVGGLVVAAPISWNTAANLTLSGPLAINAPITVAGSGGLDLEVGYITSFSIAPGAAVNFTGAPNSGASLTIGGMAFTLVYSMADLANASADDLSVGYALASDLDAGGVTYANAVIVNRGSSQPVFRGQLDGLGHVITGLTINAPSTNNVGLISELAGNVAHLGLVDATINGHNNVGALVGESIADEATMGPTTDLYQVYSTGMVSGADNVGGLAGSLTSFDIESAYSSSAVSGSINIGGLAGLLSEGWLTSQVHATGAVTGTYNVGGLIGQTDSNFSSAYATGPVSGSVMVGGLVGTFSGTIYGSYATGAVSGDGDLGGLAGGTVQGAIVGSYATGAVTASANADDVGGLIGVSEGGVDGSYATGAVTGGSSGVGGLVGSGGSITDSYATGAVTAVNAEYVGGLVGVGDSISNSYATGAVMGANYVGGLIGQNTGLVEGAYATGAVTGASFVGGLVGQNSGTVSNGYWDTHTSGQSTSAAGTGLTTAQFANAANFTGFAFTTTPGGAGWVIVDQDGTLNNAGGAAGATRPMLASEYSTSLSNGHQLQLVAMDLAASYTLAQDISLAEINNPSGAWITAEGFSPLGNTATPFTGAFDGQGHVVDGLKINGGTANLDDTGLFGVTGAASVIQNLGLTDVSIKGGNVMGGLVGENAGAIVASYVDGDVVRIEAVENLSYEDQSVGGLAGENAGSITQSYSSGLLNDTTVEHNGAYSPGSLGGLVGVNSGSIASSYSTSSVSAPLGRAGGLVGVNTGSITEDYATGAVMAPSGGGLASVNAGLIQSSYATGAVTGSYGLYGLSGGGGLVDSNNGGRIVSSYATGTVDEGSTGYAAGLVDDNNGLISGSYATGLVKDASVAGGLAVFNSSTITQSYATSAVTGQTAGGLVGVNYRGGSIVNDYAVGAVTCTCQTNAYGGVGAYGGGLVGQNMDRVITSYATGLVTTSSGSGSVGGLVGSNFGDGGPAGTVTNAYWDVQTTGQSASAGGVGLTTAQFASASNFTGFSFTTTPGGAGWVIVDQDGGLNNAGGAAGATRPLLAGEYSTTISNGHQLQLMAMAVAASYVLAGDVSLAAISNPSEVWITAEGFSPIGGSADWFTGSLNGAGHGIDGLTVNGAAAGLEHAGLFGVVGPLAAIDDLALTHAAVTGTTNVGILAGRVFSASIDGVSTGGSVSGTASVGGLIGYDAASAVTSSSSAATVSAAHQAGGLIGWNSGALSNDSAAGSVTASGSGVLALGGLVGVDYGAIDHSSASGAVSGASGLIVGGLVGDDAGAVTLSYATGAVSGYGDVGGLAGRVRGASLSDDYATGAVTGNGAGAYDLGGFAGVTGAASSLTRIYATGRITGSVFTGGLVGYNGGALTQAYWNVQTSGLYNAVGGVPGAIDATGLYTAQMAHQASYAGWNFTTVWNAPAGGAPTLR